MKTLLILLCSTSLLLAGDFTTLFMSATLYVLLLTLIIGLMFYIKQLQKESRKNSALFEYSDIPTLHLSQNGSILSVNQSALTLVGYTKKQLHSKRWYEKFLPDERAIQIRHTLHQSLKKDAQASFNAYLIRNNAKALLVKYTLTTLPHPYRSTILTIVDLSDQNDQKKSLQVLQTNLLESKKALKQLTEQFKVTFDIAINGIAILDESGAMSYINRALLEMFEYNEDYMKHLGISLVINDDESVQLLLKSAKRGEKIDKMHICSSTRSGVKLDLDLTMGYLPELEQYYMVIQDITKTLAYTAELKRSKKHLEQRVIKDCLTSAYNRTYMEEQLEHLIEVEKEPFGFIILDIDFFKKVNDTYGHLVGDDVLINLVEALKDQLRKGDTIARFGGEEFVIILPFASHEQSLNVAIKLQTHIASLHFENCPVITCSFGVESFEGQHDKRALLLAADEALYKAKESGRNCVVDARSF